MRLEGTIEVRSGAAIESVLRSAGRCLATIEEDVDPSRGAVEGSPAHPQIRPIPGDDDEPSPHVAAPPGTERGEVRRYRSVVRPPIMRADQHVLPNAKIILDTGEAPTVPRPSVIRHSVAGCPALAVTSVEQDLEAILIFEL
jgi:hypothetical protein